MKQRRKTVGSQAFGTIKSDVLFKCRLNLIEQNQKNLEMEAKHQGEIYKLIEEITASFCLVVRHE